MFSTLKGSFLFCLISLFLFSCSLKESPIVVSDIPDENQVPSVGAISVDSGCCEPGGTAVVSSSISDPNDDPLTITWSATGGSFDTTIGTNRKRTIWKAPSTSGTYTLTLKVSDAEFTESATKDITVSDTGNKVPAIISFSSPSTLRAGEMATLTSLADDPDGGTITYSWGNSCSGSKNGTFGTSTQSTSTFEAPLEKEECVITLSVRDGGTGTTSQGKVVKVSSYESILTFGQQGDCGTLNGCGPGDLYVPTAIDVDSNGNVYVVDVADAKIKKFSSAGTFLTAYPAASCSQAIPSLCSPRELYVNGDTILVSEDEKNILYRFSLDFGFKDAFGSAQFVDALTDAPGAIATDSAGNIYVVHADACRVEKFAATGTAALSFTSSCAGLTDNNLDKNSGFLPGIAVNSRDEVLVSDPKQHRIVLFTSAGQLQTFFGVEGSNLGDFSYPAKLAVDASDNLYVVDKGNNRIQVFTRLQAGKAMDVQVFTVFGTKGDKDGELTDPTDIALANNNDLYVLDSGNHRVQLFRLKSP